MIRPDAVGSIFLVVVLASGLDRICNAQTTDAEPTFVPPSRSIKLGGEAAATLGRAKNAAVVAIDVAGLKILLINEKKKEVVVGTRGGIRRGVSAETARPELLKSMREWNRFTIVEDPEQADLVFVVFEDTVEPSAFSKANGDRKARMRERLAVYARGRFDAPLWANEVRESTFGAITGSPVSKVVGKFRDELEKRVK